MPAPAADRTLDGVGVAGAVLCCALWGGNAVAVKYSIPDLPPFGCAGLRFVLSLPILVAVCRYSRQPILTDRSVWWLVGVHALLTVLQIGTFNWGTSLSEAGRSSVFINVHPLVVAPLAAILLGERMGLQGWLGLASAGCGVAILLSDRLSGGGSLRGDLIVLASGLIFGVQTIAQKKTFPVIPPVTLLLGQSLLAIPLFFAYSALAEGFESYRFTTAATVGVLYQGWAVSGLCFTTWLLLLGRYSAGRLAALAFLTPLFGVGLGNLTRGEPLTLSLVLGGVLVGVGIYLVATERTRQHRDDLALPGEDAP